MAKEKTEIKAKENEKAIAKATSEACCCGSRNNVATGGGAVYGFGLFGALYYFLSTAHSFGAVVLGILKALVWPGVLVYEALKILNLS